jgi:putative methionine-R-sulfoxide reductase with GAF domain
MDPHSILDRGGETPESNTPDSAGSVRFPAEDGGRSLAEMAERDLAATLQLLAERAQYITGATGAAIALRDDEEMVCRASAGTSAPAVGTLLQVNSGLSGESVRTKQTLRCDDASTDTRVNRESCEALGISSVVVMPLLRGDEVIGVFELFSDQPNIFEARDIAALERMGAMVHAALEHSANSLGIEHPTDQPTHPSLPISGNGHHGEAPETSSSPSILDSTLAFSQNDDLIMELENPQPEETTTAAALASTGIAFHIRKPLPSPPAPQVPPPLPFASGPAEAAPVPPQPFSAIQPEMVDEEADILEDSAEIIAPPAIHDLSDDILGEELQTTAPVAATAHDAPPVSESLQIEDSAPLGPPAPKESPASRGAVASLRKCEACGFPVSEGRQLCLDCEKKGAAQPPRAAPGQATVADPEPPVISSESAEEIDSPMPNFLGDQPEESWLATHKLVVLAILIGIIAIVAAAMLR